MGLFKLIKDGYEKDKKTWDKKIAIFMILFDTFVVFLFVILIFFIILLIVIVSLFQDIPYLSFFGLLVMVLVGFIYLPIDSIKTNFRQIIRFEKNVSKITFKPSNYTLQKFKKFVNYSNFALKRLVKSIIFMTIVSILTTIIVYPFEPDILQSLWIAIPVGLLISIFMNFFSTLFLKQKIVFSKLHNTMKSFLVILIKKYSVESGDHEIDPLKNDYELMVLFIEYMNFCFRKMDKKEIANEGHVILKLSKIEKSESLDKFLILIDTYEKPLKTISTFDISLEKQKIRPATLVGWIIGIISSFSLIISLIMMISTFILQ